MIDYASPIWSIGTAQMVLKPLAQAQRIGAQAIKEHFELSAKSKPRQKQEFFQKKSDGNCNKASIGPNATPCRKKTPPGSDSSESIQRTNGFQSPLQHMATKFGTDDTAELETIQPYCITPWEHRLKATIVVRDKAEEWASTLTEGVVYLDASFGSSNIGVGLYLRVQKNGRTVEDQLSLKVGNNERESAYYAELIAMHEVLLYIEHIWGQLHRIPPEERWLVVPSVITSDITPALQVISKPRNQSGQSIIAEIYSVAQRLKKQDGPVIRLQWIPANSGIEGADLAHRLAKKATVE